jgi:hypothetical protein
MLCYVMLCYADWKGSLQGVALYSHVQVASSVCDSAAVTPPTQQAS